MDDGGRLTDIEAAKIAGAKEIREVEKGHPVESVYIPGETFQVGLGVADPTAPGKMRSDAPR